MISQINTADVIKTAEETLGFPVTGHQSLSDELLASLMRRHAGIVCPCSFLTLKNSFLNSLQFLFDEAALADRVDSVIEWLIVYGDLLELNDVAIDDSNINGTWLFLAPPSFISRKTGDIVLTGIIPDQDNCLVSSLKQKISSKKFLRIINGYQNEDLKLELEQNGFSEISEDAWLKIPRSQAPDLFVLNMEQRLQSSYATGEIKDLQIITFSKPVTHYKSRWESPNSTHTGSFIGRRPQHFGSPLWCYVGLKEGVPNRILDFPFIYSKLRGCDLAWHLQMAIDYCHHTPQIYKKRYEEKFTNFDFFSPLPKWCERRLSLFGLPTHEHKSLLSFKIPNNYVESEERFLQEHLWLECSMN